MLFPTYFRLSSLRTNVLKADFWQQFAVAKEEKVEQHRDVGRRHVLVSKRNQAQDECTSVFVQVPAPAATEIRS